MISVAATVLVITCLVILIIALYKNGYICHSDPLEYVDSPDGKNQVLYGIQDCFVTPPTTMWVNLNYKEIVGFDSGPQPLDVKWVNNNEVSIILPQSAVITTKETTDLDGIKINFSK